MTLMYPYIYFPKYQILKKLSKCDTISVVDFINLFNKNGKSRYDQTLILTVLEKAILDDYVKSDNCNEEIMLANIKILPLGLEYLQNTLERKLLFWIPYSITTLIALAALLISVCDIWQSNSANDPQILLRYVPEHPYTRTVPMLFPLCATL